MFTLIFFLICDSRSTCCSSNSLFPIGSVEILRGRDNQAFSVENVFFLGGGRRGWKIGAKRTSMGGVLIFSATTG